MSQNKNDSAQKRGLLFTDSLSEMKSTKTIAFCGVMAALAVVLSLVARIQIGDYIRIGFSELPNILVDTMFGPAVGGLFGGALDILKFIAKPTGAYFPGFTLSAVLGGLIYGMFFYRKKITIPRVFAANLLVKGLVNICMNSFWLYILYNKGVLGMIPARITTNLIMLPIDTAICYFMLKGVQKAGVTKLVRPARA
jgi:ECF transporter S component (folate family)